jgi:benzylsuccinate CoA-transferase BbsE subunit
MSEDEAVRLSTPSAPDVGMLGGLRVLDLAGDSLAYAGRVLVELGADVILIEPPGGCAARRHPPLVTMTTGATVSAFFAYMAAGKRSVTIDDTAHAGRSLLERLIVDADVVLLPDDVDAIKSRSLDETTLRSLNEGLIVTSLTPFGGNGPKRHWKGSELVAWASSGIMAGMGDPDRPPILPGGGIAQSVSSLNATIGTLLALRSRQRTTRGQLVDISMQEGVLSISLESGPLLALEGRSQARTANKRHIGPAHGLFAVQDGSVEIVAILPRQWDAMAEWIRDELGIEEATLDVFRGSQVSRTQFTELINSWVVELAGRYTKEAFFTEAQRRHIPSGLLNSTADLLHHPQLDAVGGWEEVEYVDAGQFRSPRGPISFDGVAVHVGPVPRAGQDNDEIFRTRLGLSEAEILRLHADGVI